MNKDELIEKLQRQEDEKLKTYDWPYHTLIQVIYESVIELVKES